MRPTRVFALPAAPWPVLLAAALAAPHVQLERDARAGVRG